MKKYSYRILNVVSRQTSWFLTYFSRNILMGKIMYVYKFLNGGWLAGQQNSYVCWNQHFHGNIYPYLSFIVYVYVHLCYRAFTRYFCGAGCFIWDVFTSTLRSTSMGKWQLQSRTQSSTQNLFIIFTSFLK